MKNLWQNYLSKRSFLRQDDNTKTFKIHHLKFKINYPTLTLAL